MSIEVRNLFRIEVQEDSGSWLDITGPSANVNIDRDELNVSSLTLRLYDANLDPTQNELIRKGRPVRVSTVHGDELFVGNVLTGGVAYHLLAREERKRAEVNLTAVDAATPLAAAPRPEGVATVPELAYVLAGTGVTYSLNGGAGTTDAEVVSYNENASALDQIALTRDSRLGYAWVDRTGVLRVWDRASIPATIAQVLDENDYLSDINLDVDLDRLVNSVIVKVLAVVATSGAVEEIAFGPYVDEASVLAYGEHRQEFTVQGFDPTDGAAIEVYAGEILAASATPRLRVNALTLPIRTNDDLPKALLDLYDLVTVVNGRASLDEDARITTISHSITPDKAAPSGAKWLVTVGFVADGSVAASTAPPSAPAVVRDVLDDVTVVTDDLAGGLQDAYDRADAAALAAATAATSATAAQTSANGKNTIWYSTSGPGTTANKAGDVWFQKDATTQGIIAQYEGLGGTSWAARQLRNEVIANLDAGKLTAGSAFTNALTVKTNLTLGDASTNGVIQSYNFAGSSVGVFIDKFGLVAKGGSIAGAMITGGTVEGAVVKTGSSGQRVEIRDAATASGGESAIELYTGSVSADGPAIVKALNSGGAQELYLRAPISGTPGPGAPRIELRNFGASSDAVIFAGTALTVTATNAATFNCPVTADSIYVGGRTVNAINFDRANTTVDSSSQVTVTHGLSATPASVTCTGRSSNGRTYSVTARGGTTFTVEVRAADGALLAGSTSVDFDWTAMA